jgi:hypothetical protein
MLDDSPTQKIAGAVGADRFARQATVSAPVIVVAGSGTPSGSNRVPPVEAGNSTGGTDCVG